jgi:uncharacterized coiled-coil protein SlyX
MKLFFIVSIALLSASSQAGVLIESAERTTKNGGERPSQTMQIQDGKARIDVGADKLTAMIFREEALYMIDKQRRTYTVMDSATLERTMGALNDAMAQMRAQMATMPPEQRAMMENMMKQNGLAMPGAAEKKPVYDAVATGATEKAAGQTCKVWNVKRDGALWQQLCVVPNSSLPGRDEFQALAKKMRALVEKMGPVATQFAGNPTQQDEALAVKLDGVPFITRRYRDGVLDGSEIVVKAWRTQAVAPSEFELPAGFMKQELPSMPGGKR